ncbi:unnamed protein product [Spirodela intermedia]|uniref:Uncharacterized protein n=1 Tax=Spirodela intermedia TaxID=51605 RepID=A0A7I8L5K4_SPIIN|nr:unnamed protein product [Spirodela intermedia]
MLLGLDLIPRETTLCFWVNSFSSDHVKSGYFLLSPAAAVPSPTRSSGGRRSSSSLGQRKKAMDRLSWFLFTTALWRQLLYLPFDSACGGR